MSSVRVEHLQKSFGDLKVLKDVNMEIEKGEVVCIIGPSGSGKSTLLRCLNRLERITGGKLFIDDELISHRENDKSIVKVDKHQLVELRTKVGMVFQRFNLFPHKTALENVTLAPMIVKKANKEEIEKRGLELLDMVGLKDRADEYPSRLSGGQQQRVAIARALAAKPAMILADEPTGNLDSKTSQDVLSLLKVTGQQFGQTIVMITHNEAIAQMADRIIRIDDGMIVKGGEGND